MENKLKKNSINTVIYLLLAAMLVSVVLVSVFTVSSRRRGKDTVSDDSSGGIVTSPSADSGTAASNAAEDVLTPDTAPKPDDTIAPDTTAAANEVEETLPASAGKEELPASIGIRYFVIPTAGTVAKEFEIDIPVYSLTMNDYRAHTGVDIAAPLGTDVVTASGGTVCKIWNDQLMGRCVTVDHGDDIYTTYMNLAEDSASQLSVGDKVSMGQSIGVVGESALIEISEEPHLHLEMKVNGSFVDPLEYMGIASPQETVYGD